MIESVLNEDTTAGAHLVLEEIIEARFSSDFTAGPDSSGAVILALLVGPVVDVGIGDGHGIVPFGSRQSSFRRASSHDLWDGKRVTRATTTRAET